MKNCKNNAFAVGVLFHSRGFKEGLMNVLVIFRLLSVNLPWSGKEIKEVDILKWL